MIIRIILPVILICQMKSLTFPDGVDMRRGGATESEGQAVWVVRDLHNPGREKTSPTSES